MAEASRRIKLVASHFVPEVQRTIVARPANTKAELETGDDLKLSFDNGVLTREQREFYEKNGFLLVRNLVDPDELSKYTEHFVKICNGEVKRVPTMTVMRDVTQKGKKKVGQSNITKVQDFQDDPALFAYCKNPNILKYVGTFVGPDIKSIHTMLIHKPPGIGASGTHPDHQDLHYFPFRPAARIVCAWTAMEAISKENGGLYVVPGSHLDPGTLLKHDYPEFTVNKAYHEIQGYKAPEDKRVHLVMDVGDTVFFHPLLIHGSGPNNTDRYRKAISCHYASAHCEYIDVKGTVQEHLAKEIEEMAKIKTKRTLGQAVSISFTDIWRMKSRLVAGKPGTL